MVSQGEAGAPTRALPLSPIGASELEPGAGRHHRRSACVHGRDDLLGVDALQVDRGRAEIGVAELALDDVERDSLAGEFDRVGMAQLVRREPAP
jgi:hypothetical protein